MSVTNMKVGLHVLLNDWSPDAPAHANITGADLIDLAAQAGSKIVRIPLDLSVVGSSGAPSWALTKIEEWLTLAQQKNLQVIFEPGQTPTDLSQTGTVDGEPGNSADIDELGNRFATLVEQVYTQFSHLTDVIRGWEVGNEPNLSYEYTPGYQDYDFSKNRFFTVSTDNAEYYANYLHAANEAVKVVENRLGISIDIIGAGIAHNDAAYMDRMFETLSYLGADIDGFSIHPYTTYDLAYTDPASGRPTDWVINPDLSDGNSWDYYHNFQEALYNIQEHMNFYGYGGSDLWLTEFGVPSYLGYRNAGSEGLLDQANWFAEALGVIDSWGNDNLQGIMAHHVLDNQTFEVNQQYNAYDSSPNNDGSSGEAEGAFGLFHSVNGVIEEKMAIEVIRAIAGGQDYFSQANRILNLVSSDVLDISGWGSSGAGFTNGYIALTNGGDDQITGSAFDDSLFAGDGDDTINGMAGDDRIYGGRGNDSIAGGEGSDDLYGNHGDDVFDAGWGVNRVDGGTGFDILVLYGSASDYTITGDGAYLTATESTGLQTTSALNIEQIYYTGTGERVDLSNTDITRGNGGLAGNSSSIGNGKYVPNASPFDATDYTEALSLSTDFFYAQYSGDLWDGFPISWRGDSALQDGTDVGVDLTGGWYDAGDHVKFGLPMAYATTVLAWGAIDFGDSYRAADSYDDLLDHLQWTTDYFLRAYDDRGTADVSDDIFYAQVGDPYADHSYWGAPENMAMSRPAYAVTASNPGSEVTAETAAAMAATSIVMREAGQTALADELIASAEKLFEFADTYRGDYHDAIPVVSEFYRSYSGYNDELAWAASWLYQATGTADYLAKAKTLFYGNTHTSFSWDDKAMGTAALLAKQTGDWLYFSDLNEHLNWLSSRPTVQGTSTNDGLSFISEWGSNRYAAASAFIMTQYADALYRRSETGDADEAAKALDFAVAQVDYVLGDNSADQSFLVGFGNNFPLNPHHRAASGQGEYDPGNNLHTIYGAMVGGPINTNGEYNDVRHDYQSNEVAVDYNAGFSGAVAGILSHIVGNDTDATNVISGTPGSDSLSGSSQNDRLNSGAGDDTLYGGAGDDVLIGGSGADVLDGGDGLDIASYEDSTVGLWVELDEPHKNTGDAAGDSYVSIEGLRGSQFDDVIWGDGADNVLLGEAGDDQIGGLGGNDRIFGGAGNDTLYGGEGDDLLDGGTGLTDQVNYDGAASDYTLTRNADGSMTVSHAQYGTDTLKDVEKVLFYGESRTYDIGDLGTANPGVSVGTGHSNYFGGTADDDLIRFTGGTGNYVDAADGVDTIDFDAAVADFEILGQGDHFTVTNTVTGDAVQFANVEYLTFDDATSVSLADLVANSSHAPGDTWFDPEPIGGLI